MEEINSSNKEIEVAEDMVEVAIEEEVEYFRIMGHGIKFVILWDIQKISATISLVMVSFPKMRIRLTFFMEQISLEVKARCLL